MVVKPGADRWRRGGVFESSVDSYGSQTRIHVTSVVSGFESGANSYGNQTEFLWYNI